MRNLLCTTLIATVLLLSSCRSKESMLMVSKSRSEAELAVGQLQSWFSAAGGRLHMYSSTDTLGYVAYQAQDVQQGVLLFEEDECIYQELELSCSPCIESYLLHMTTDRQYDFKKIDEHNYVSTTEGKKIVLRIINSSTQTELTCKKISARIVPNDKT